MYVPSESFIISERQMIMNTVIHPIPPVFDRNSKILILGSFPSVKSREGHFFYHHPQNRFWKTLAGILAVPVPGSIDEKKEFETGQISCAVFTSASTVKGFVEGTKGLDYSKVKAACIGRQTKAAAESFGMKAYMSEKATIDSLVKLVEDMKRSE